MLVARRELPGFASETKVRVVVLEDFTRYSDAIVGELVDADACLWCVGTYNADEKVEIAYPKAFFEGMVKTEEWKRREKVFRFLYLGGAFTETDQSKQLWFLPTARRVRGRAQTMALDWQDDERSGREVEERGC